MPSEQGRHMMRMRWPGLDAEVTVRLLDDLAPTLSKDMWEALPFSSIQGHALITGDMMFATVPVTSLVRENVTLFTSMPVGGCFFGRNSQNLGVVYGPLSEPEGHSIWGQVIEEDFGTLKRVGDAVWDNLMLPWSRDPDGVRTRRHLLVEYSAL
jgi:hypothetical protein